MSNLLHLAAFSALLYQVTVTITALYAMLARTPQRRRSGHAVLRLLLRHPPKPGADFDTDQRAKR